VNHRGETSRGENSLQGKKGRGERTLNGNGFCSQKKAGGGKEEEISYSKEKKAT